MRLPLFGLLLCCATALVEASVPYYDHPLPSNFRVYGGFREDNLKFRIGDSDEIPKTLAVAKWRNLKIAQVGGSFNYTSFNNYYFRMNGDYGRVVDGRGRTQNFDLAFCNRCASSCFSRNRSSDFSSDRSRSSRFFTNKSSSSSSSFSDSSSSTSLNSSLEDLVEEFSRQEADSDTGYVADLEGGVGYKFISGGGRSWIAGVGGWSYHKQSFEMSRFKQTVDLDNLVGYGRIPGLHGKYIASWTGPWLGIDFLATVEYDVFIYGSVEWHWAKFRADGRWSLDNEYDAHIRQKARGYGVVSWLGIGWTPCEAWAIGVSGGYQIWSTQPKGRNRASIDNDLPLDDNIDLTFPVLERSSLRRVRWNSYCVNVEVSYIF